jgi:hypothetical protein
MDRAGGLTSHRATLVAGDPLLDLRICQPDRRAPRVSHKERCQWNVVSGLMDCLHHEEGCHLIGTPPSAGIRGLFDSNPHHSPHPSLCCAFRGWAGAWSSRVGASHYGTIVLECNTAQSVA